MKLEKDQHSSKKEVNHCKSKRIKISKVFKQSSYQNRHTQNSSQESLNKNYASYHELCCTQFTNSEIPPGIYYYYTIYNQLISSLW